jgi:hypothetical protein
MKDQVCTALYPAYRLVAVKCTRDQVERDQVERDQVERGSITSQIELLSPYTCTSWQLYGCLPQAFAVSCEALAYIPEHCSISTAIDNWREKRNVDWY